MSEKQWIWINLGGILTFGLFLLISLITRGQNALVVMTEIIGFITLIFAIITFIYIKNDNRWLCISIIAYTIPWIVFGVGYEIGIEESMNNFNLWFAIFYGFIIASFVFMQRSYHNLTNIFKLVPAFFLFFHSILLLYMVVLHIWWLLPF
ncbi:hypothetical protein [Halobacillus seohaensis]|uniref:Uncharacterized protein n=1 Tax=Halobacillus seohaensis TaxID=447421 RepID=A0ABW2EP45_9BACI